MTIKAPYNFATVGRKVYRPSWADKVNQDVPFEDGECACLKLRFTAESAIYVRNGSSRSQQENQTDEHKRFSSHDGRYFLPGTSVKGMVRNVLEILSFSALTPLNDHKYTYRDLSSAHNAYLTTFRESRPHCGWLSRGDDGSWRIADHGTPGRISLECLDTMKGTRLASYFRGDHPKADYRKDREKTAKRKFELIEGIDLRGVFSTYMDRAGREVAEPDQCGRAGTIVLTGHPSKKKKYDFVIFDRDAPVLLPVPKQVEEDFRFAYFEGEPDKESVDWKYWRKKLGEGEAVPVFFRPDGKGGVMDMGLTYLYKLAYDKRTKECLYGHEGKGPDMAQTVFGSVDGDSFRGRIQFSHAFAVGQPHELEEKHEVLGGPKASYHPAYVKQRNGKENGKANPYTKYESGAEIRGWKRYPVHSDGVKMNRPEGVSDKVYSRFTPLKAGTVFEGKVRIHNLRKAEIGALLSAVTFHDTDSCRHSIGMAKPLGYGKLKVEITDMGDLKHTRQDYLKSFEQVLAMDGPQPIENWSQQPQIRELLTMATAQENNGPAALEYMTLDEHIAAKNADEYLREYSNLPGINVVTPSPLLQPEELRELKEAKEEEARQLAAREAEIKEQQLRQEQMAEEARKLAEQAARKAEAEKLRAMKSAEIIEAGLSALHEDIEAREIGVIVAKYSAEKGVLEDSDLEVIKSAVMKNFENANKKKRRQWNLPPNKSKFWKPMRDSLGEDLIRKWQSEFK